MFLAFTGNLAATEPEAVDFGREIRPLLSDRCFSCHGPDEENRESDLRVDRLQSLLEERGGYRAIVPGDSAASELVQRISSTDESLVMPPPDMGKPLSTEEIEKIRRWVDAGAPWQQHWAYEQPKWTPTPQVVLREQSGDQQNWIDAFIAQELQKVGGRFSPPANPTTLARRLAFDLTGLPPEFSAVETLSAGDSDALSRYVDRLLASPAFGERLAMYWLDLVRFADTVGYHGDQDHSISPYRDYVVNALNDNRPFNLFTIDQLAGDLVDEPTT